MSQLDQMCLDGRPSLDDVTTTESQKQNIQAILELLEQSAQADESTPVVTTLHLIVSAMDGKKAPPFITLTLFNLQPTLISSELDQ